MRDRDYVRVLEVFQDQILRNLKKLNLNFAFPELKNDSKPWTRS